MAMPGGKPRPQDCTQGRNSTNPKEGNLSKPGCKRIRVRFLKQKAKIDLVGVVP
ncbi:MAG: hypothetical protein PHP55_04070 [Methanoculleus sp.]|nr:hypothetical protein [Methanoculleus sp.]